MKQADQGHVTVHGGPSVPGYPEACRFFLETNRHVDITVRGEGERTAAQLVTHLLARGLDKGRWLEDLETVKGIAWLRADGVWAATPDQDRITNLDEILRPI